MVLHHPIAVAAPFFVVLAEVVTNTQFSWTQALLVYGPLGLWVAWFVIRDKLDREERKLERIEAQKKHEENIAAQKRVEEAFQSVTTSLIVGFAAMKNIDQGYSELLQKLDSDKRKGS